MIRELKIKPHSVSLHSSVRLQSPAAAWGTQPAPQRLGACTGAASGEVYQDRVCALTLSKPEGPHEGLSDKSLCRCAETSMRSVPVWLVMKRQGTRLRCPPPRAEGLLSPAALALQPEHRNPGSVYLARERGP